MKNKNTYFRKNWKLLLTTFFFTVFPIAACLILLTMYSSGKVPLEKWFTSFGIKNNEYHIHNVLLSFIIVSYLLVFINLLIYLIETQRKAIDYNGSNNLFKKINLGGQLVNLAVLITIGIFILRVSDYNDIIHFNRYISIGIFLAFALTDGLFWYQEFLERKTLEEQKLLIDKKQITEETRKLIETEKENAKIKINQCSNNIAFSRKSILLINLPALLILSFSLYLITKIEDNEFFMCHLNGTVLCTIEHFNLFIDGLETGVIFTSIIITQIIFSVLKIKWSYRRFQIEGNTPPADPKTADQAKGETTLQQETAANITPQRKAGT